MCKYITYLFIFIFLLSLCGFNTVSATENIWREAEGASSITTPLQIVDDTTASSGEYIVASSVANNTNPPSSGIATYSITIKEGGVYRMYVRVRCETSGDNDDSCYVRIQGATLNLTGLTDGWISDNNIDYQVTNSTDWFWKQVGNYSAFPGNDYAEFTMTPGTYTVEIAYREDGTDIDGFLITNETDIDTAALPAQIPGEEAGPLVIGDFEGDLDGWFSWPDSGSTLEVGTTGVTSGDNGLDLTVTGGYFQIGWAVPSGYVLDLSNVTTLQLDVSMKVADFPPGTWTKVDAIAINSELGWRQIGPTSVVDNDTGEEVPSMDWGTWAPDSNRTITWDIAAAGYDWTGFEESSYQEIVISAMGNGVFHIDNIRLYGAKLLPKVKWVSEMADADGDGIADDQGWIDLLTENGYYVSVPPAKEDPNAVYNPYWMVMDANKVAELNSAALVVFSRNTNSGNYDEPNEPTMWNSVTTPTILLNAYLARNNRWKWINSSGTLDNIGAPLMEVIDPNHPIFKGVTFLSENIIDFLDPNVDSGRTTFINSNDVGNGVLLAQTYLGTQAYIAEWEAGTEFYDGAGQIAGGRRMLFTSGIHSNTSGFGGNLNLTAEGIKVFLNAVDYMIKPATAVTLGDDADTWTVGNDPNTSHGMDEFMAIQGGSSDRTGFVRFDLSGLDIYSIKSASLTLTVHGSIPKPPYRNDSVVSGRFALYGLNNVVGNTPQDWGEDVLTSANTGAEMDWTAGTVVTEGGLTTNLDDYMPGISEVYSASSSPANASLGATITISGDALVSFIQSRVDDDGLVTFILKDDDGSDKGYGLCTKEYPDATYQPKLELQYK